MSSAISGIGTIFHKWNGSAWVTIAEVASIKGPGMKRDTIEVTNFDSNMYKEIISGLRDGGTVTMSMNFLRDTLDIMKADFESDDLQVYEIVLPDTDATSFEFQALVTELPLSITPKDAITMDVTFQVSGQVTVNDGGNSQSALG